MRLLFKKASVADAASITAMVLELTNEICLRCADPSTLEHDPALTARLCAEWLEQGHYQAVIAYVDDEPAGVATMVETHALYALGKIGIVQEFYVAPRYRSQQIGARLMAAALADARERRLTCLELCTPPLPAFAQTLAFYQQQGFKPVGGRKMRRKV